MSKRTVFTTVTPLPYGLTREAAVAFLHDHLQMIDLNPLVRDRHRIPPPPHAPDEELGCVWYSLTDRVSYLPGGLASSDVTYTAAFHDLSRGIQTHCYAPMGVETRSKWSIGGSMPGEPLEPVELGLGAPTTGLYLREDVDLRCNVFMTSFVKKTIKRSHSGLVDRLHDLAKSQTSSGGPAAALQQRRDVQIAAPGVSWQRGHRVPGQGTNASSPTLAIGANQFDDRPLPPTPPAEPYDAKPPPSFDPLGQHGAQAAGLE
ncbi:uncharacterized protein MAM_05157 [Metarhizium album ARSEF 1941]|uniref:DUF7053 domain-containing protein n=1 Tax=Metarhizium album (strain ARSEF 1941) TaxID=1081103 RepID=A0A0B2WSN5_METAS|nr:uncharacterized protein MAM_05157 [Metarhizium album ARSEF 1941]KHN97048.1 hypothetical protein MAM_05157 [Metarhizium album ARSEF 1941]